MLQLEYKIKKANDFESEGKFLHAIQIYKSIIEMDSKYSLAYVKLADLYDRIGKHEAAISLLNNFLLEYSDDKEIRLFLGQILINHLLWNEAIEILSYFTPEEQPLASFLLGYAYFMNHELEISKINFQNFLSFSSNVEFNAEANLYIAKISIGLNQFNEALEAAKKAEEIFGYNWEVHLVYAIISYQKGMYLHALASIEKAKNLNPQEISLNEWAGKIHFKLGDYVNAEKYFLEYVKNSEADALTYSYLGLVCLNFNKQKDAKIYFDRALKLDPNNEIALDGKKKCSRKS
ncbi:MAG: tetratricopeptide repeat protein [Ignavibacteriales bacterium]|nr:tetratricopeptide repeat protein [Ignavibacteriales bacterium]